MMREIKLSDPNSSVVLRENQYQAIKTSLMGIGRLLKILYQTQNLKLDDSERSEFA